MIINDNGKLYQVIQTDIVTQLQELENTNAMVVKGDEPVFDTFEDELTHLIQKWEVDRHAGVGTKVLIELLMRLVRAFEYQKIAGTPANVPHAANKLSMSLLPENEPLTND